MKKNLLVGQSGGPTPVINASLWGVVTEGLRNENIRTVYGMINGIQGFLKGKVKDMAELTEDEMMRLRLTPASYLGSCRYKLPENLDDAVYPEIYRRLEELGIGYFLYIGGNDSMDTVSKLSRYNEKIGGEIRFIGVPKTIDNDLIMTDHTPGYGSAARFVATAVREMVLDAEVYDTSSVTVIELMGRSAGWLTASSVLARRFEGDNPVMVYLPERNFDIDEFLTLLKAKLAERKNVVVCVSEGIHDDKDTCICEYGQATGLDAFGHKMLAGCGKYLENLIREKLGVKVRSVELNVMQRCHISDASETDLVEAGECGATGVRFALEGKTGLMVSMERIADEPYELRFTGIDVNMACNAVKEVPQAWITEDGADLTEDFVKYARPLIQGAVRAPEKDGLPNFLYR